MKTKLRDQDWIPDNENAGMSVYQAAKVLGVSVHMVGKLVREGKIPHYRIGKRVILTMKDIREFLDGCKKGNR